MEQVGIPAVVVCTSLFLKQGQLMASVHGYENYPLVEVLHPLAIAPESALKQEAARVLEFVLSGLLKKKL